MGIFDKISQSASDMVDSANELMSAHGFDDALAKLKGYKTSSWQGLNPHLIAKIYPLKVVYTEDRKLYVQDESKGAPVLAPILDGAEIEYSFNWQSPFEQSGVENKAPALSAMVQSGVMTQISDWIFGDSKITSELKDQEGRTGITKLNSMQTFNGMPPVKISCKLLFRAMTNARKEVNEPIKQLLKWALPQSLSSDGTVINIAKSAGNGKIVDGLMPSLAPLVVAMEYKGRVYKPLVIEAISDPITSPTTRDGYYARAEVGITLCSLTAWDRNDIETIYRRG